jgi:hypothetical protein
MSLQSTVFHKKIQRKKKKKQAKKQNQKIKDLSFHTHIGSLDLGIDLRVDIARLVDHCLNTGHVFEIDAGFADNRGDLVGLWRVLGVDLAHHTRSIDRPVHKLRGSLPA